MKKLTLLAVVVAALTFAAAPSAQASTQTCGKVDATNIGCRAAKAKVAWWSRTWKFWYRGGQAEGKSFQAGRWKCERYDAHMICREDAQTIRFEQTGRQTKCGTGDEIWASLNVKCPLAYQLVIGVRESSSKRLFEDYELKWKCRSWKDAYGETARQCVTEGGVYGVEWTEAGSEIPDEQNI